MGLGERRCGGPSLVSPAPVAHNAPQMTADRPATVYNIQALRGLAAMFVVCLHLEPAFTALGVPPPAGGVELFFVISGFIMTLTTRRVPTSPATFLAQRVARIVPIYWLFTFGIFIGAAIAPQLFVNSRPEIGKLLLSLGFIAYSKNGITAQPLLFVGWTLNYEMAFYLLFTAGLAAGRWGLALIVAVLAGAVVAGAFVDPAAIVARFYTSPYLLLFAVGIGVALAAERGFAWARGRRWLLVAWIAAATPVMLFGEHHWPGVNPAWTVGPAAAIVLYGAVGLERLGTATRNRTLLRLGDASYAIYLSHPFLTVAMLLLVARLPATPVVAVLTILITLLFAAVTGWLIHRYVERPLTTAARRLLLPGNAAARRWTGPSASLRP